MFGTVRITIIHKNYNLTQSVPITVDVSPLMTDIPTRATQYDLVNKEKSIYAKYGLIWAGQTFDGTKDGNPNGQRVGKEVFKVGASSFTFYVDPATISVLEIVPTSLNNKKVAQ